MKDCLPNIIVKLEVNFQAEITILKRKEECTYDIILEFSTWEYNSNPNIYMHTKCTSKFIGFILKI